MPCFSRVVMFVVSLWCLAACGIQASAGRVGVADFPYRSSAFDYKMAWKTTRTDNGVNIDGVLKYIRYAHIDNSQITVWLLDRDRRVLARAADIPFPQQRQKEEESTFSLKLDNVVLDQGDILKFVIHYQGKDGETGGIDWVSGFSADALTGEVLRNESSKEDGW